MTQSIPKAVPPAISGDGGTRWATHYWLIHSALLSVKPQPVSGYQRPATPLTRFFGGSGNTLLQTWFGRRRPSMRGARDGHTPRPPTDAQIPEIRTISVTADDYRRFSLQGQAPASRQQVFGRVGGCPGRVQIK